MSHSGPTGADRLLQALQHGLALHQSGRFAEAAETYREILRAHPDQPETLDLYGVLLHQTGNNRDAVGILGKAVALRPKSASILNHYGAVQRGLGDLEGAIHSFGTAARLQPSLHEATYNLAVSLDQVGRYREALVKAREAVDLAPDNPEYRLALAAALRRLDSDEEAVTELRAAVSLGGPVPRFLLPLARLLLKLDRKDEVRRVVRKAIVVQPDEKDGYGLLASLESTIGLARRSVTIAPGDGVNWSLYASKLCERLEDVPAMAAARKAMILRPDLISAYLTFSDSVNRKYLYRQALDAANRGLVIDPKSHQLAVWAAFGELLLGDVARGWKLYRRRRWLPDEYPRLGLPPVWSDAAAPDGLLMVCAEQGLGDEYLFLSCLPDLLRIKSALLVECDPRNLALFQRSFPDIRFFPRTITERAEGGPVWDYREICGAYQPTRHVLAADLMERFGVGIGRPALERGYIRADPTERGHWAEWLRSLGDAPKVGISWRSGSVDAVRSDFYFTLEDVVDALGGDQAIFVSVVYVDASEELQALAERRQIKVHDPPGIDQRNELDRVAALLTELDIVVSVDNAVVAIAGSCGVPTIMLERGTFQISGDGDALFANVHPCLEGSRVFDRREVLAAAGDRFRALLGRTSA
jgi:Flp pilus assembly protein TadD